MIEKLLAGIRDNDLSQVREILGHHPELAGAPVAKARLYDAPILHWLYAGDSPFHLVAAAHRDTMVKPMLAAGGDPNVTGPHRNTRPLHYAADGVVGVEGWDPARQVRTLQALLKAGARLDAVDKNGATPLNRAVRTRSFAAVKFLLEAGADPTQPNESGSTPFHLAVQPTGRGGSGEPIAREAQRSMVELFVAKGVSPELRDGKGKSVREAARGDWVRELLNTR